MTSLTWGMTAYFRIVDFVVFLGLERKQTSVISILCSILLVDNSQITALFSDGQRNQFEPVVVLIPE